MAEYSYAECHLYCLSVTLSFVIVNAIFLSVNMPSFVAPKKVLLQIYKNQKLELRSALFSQPVLLAKDPTVWLDAARPPKKYICKYLKLNLIFLSGISTCRFYYFPTKIISRHLLQNIFLSILKRY